MFRWLIAAGIVGTAIMTALYFIIANRSRDLHDIWHARLNQIPFCEAGSTFGVPPEIVAGVILAEDLLNRSAVDIAQDTIFRILLNTRDENWWTRWAADAMRLADDAEDLHIVSNKWPPYVVSSGVVMSIGPAQITPRTALRACAYLNQAASLCKEGPRFLIRRMLDELGAPDVAAMVLRFERDAHAASVGIDLSSDVGRWATAYNFGGDYYRRAFAHQFPTNAFGRWVASNVDKIRVHLSCPDRGSLEIKVLGSTAHGRWPKVASGHQSGINLDP
jgi:hypothetical protein